MVWQEKLAILAIVGLAIGITTYAVSKDIERQEKRAAYRKGVCASFEENKRQWIADGSPGGYEVLRGFLMVDGICGGYLP